MHASVGSMVDVKLGKKYHNFCVSCDLFFRKFTGDWVYSFKNCERKKAIMAFLIYSVMVVSKETDECIEFCGKLEISFIRFLRTFFHIAVFSNNFPFINFWLY